MVSASRSGSGLRRSEATWIRMVKRAPRIVRYREGAASSWRRSGLHDDAISGSLTVEAMQCLFAESHASWL
jgi:hypothetical protein